MIKLTPIAKKRIERFKSIKRAYLSLIILTLTYILSLFSNLICNNHPYYVSYEGKSYFPIFVNYLKSDFLPDQDGTPANYKVLQRHEAFKSNPDNYMVFPPVPFGAEENVEMKYFNFSKNITLKFQKESSIGAITLRRDHTIRKFDGKELFSKENVKYKRKPISEFIKTSNTFKTALKKRFENSTAPQFKEETTLFNNKINIILIPFKKREFKPKTTRIRIVKVDDPASAKWNDSVKTNPAGEFLTAKPKCWDILSSEQKNIISSKIITRSKDFVDTIYISINNENYGVSFDRFEPNYPLKPIDNHPMGLDNSGRDVLTQIIYAFRIGLSFGLILVVVTITLGVIIGGVQGYFAGKIDLLGQRFIEIWSALPFLYVMILLGSVFGKSFGLLLFIYALFNWIGISAYIRAEFLKLRKTSFVEAAKCLGISDTTIMIRHILPNALVPIITFLPFMLVGSIGSLAVLDFLGFGLPVGTPSWGELLRQANIDPSAWWLILYPSLALFFVMLLGVMIGDGIRAAFDPRKFNKIE